ncbi:probable global transcription activator SNF2L1 [Oscarella lobularis]|uniref:probable global transcription activator SNF2L1 n=1 Tax=Oscarella lobularis TaxID=121494 RepID=UPI0033140C68
MATKKKTNAEESTTASPMTEESSKTTFDEETEEREEADAERAPSDKEEKAESDEDYEDPKEAKSQASGKEMSPPMDEQSISKSFVEQDPVASRGINKKEEDEELLEESRTSRSLTRFSAFSFLHQEQGDESYQIRGPIWLISLYEQRINETLAD